MTLQIGRVTGLAGAVDWKARGDIVTIAGRYAAGSKDLSRVVREQLLGYNLNPDEPVIPIISTADQRINGFYRIASVEVPSPPSLLASNGILEFTVQAERVASGFASPQVESMISGALMANDHAIAAGTAQPFHAFPLDAFEYTAGLAGTPVTRPLDTAGGGPSSINWFQMGSTYKALARFSLGLPISYIGDGKTSWYDGACRIITFDPISHTVVGRQEAITSQRYQLTNDLVKVTLPTFLIQPSWVDNTNTYRTAVIGGSAIAISGAAAGTLDNPAGPPYAGVRVLRNAPEEVIVRQPVKPINGLQYGPVYLDVSLRRGSRIVRVYLVSAVSDTWKAWWGTLGPPATALTGGARQTTADANGNRIVMMSSKTHAVDVTHFALTASASRTTFDVGFSMELGGGSAGIYDTAQEQIYQYLAAQAERMYVVAR